MLRKVALLANCALLVRVVLRVARVIEPDGLWVVTKCRFWSIAS
ncbi:hypothetical protein RESH_03706 [Rhodopirellula europaea SH398]|uniref:Uncharacterized protein n=2 Tax=Rhodopirellula europaea TaxID=1263866 RepID=M5S2C6_9BACT|nr:hypothetical protein RE6C_04694 [Rhodopirellula europaea 6C]EMI25700.1 hypothetical protein RESH_03706 [Rhodopirellula europaea SH398]